MKFSRWTPEEVTFLVDNYALLGAEAVAKRIDKSLNSVRQRASQLGVVRKPRWTPRDAEFLCQHYGDKGARYCAEELGYGESYIYKKAGELGLRGTTAYGRYVGLEPVIEEMYMAGCGPKLIAETLGLNVNTLESRICEWGMNEVREMHRQDVAREIAEKHGVKV